MPSLLVVVAHVVQRLAAGRAGLPPRSPRPPVDRAALTKGDIGEDKLSWELTPQDLGTARVSLTHELQAGWTCRSGFARSLDQYPKETEVSCETARAWTEF